YVMQCLPPALGALRPFKQFMIYKLVPSATRPGKTDKFPCSLSGDVVSAHDMSHWVDADTACTEATRRGAGWGVAFILSDDDPFFFVDIDDCLLPDRTWSPIAIELCTQFAGAAVEVSQSGRGLHIIGSIDQVPEHGCKNIPLGLECYTGKRFIALTGTSASGDAAARFDTQFDAVVNKYFSADVQPLSPQSWTTTHCDGSFPIDDDDRLIAKALDTTSATSVFTCKASFRDLWERNVSVLADTYPDEVREFDASSADAALAQHLAFWTGNNCERIERLMRRSGLVRPKWDKHKSYVQRTVCNAVARQTSWYSVGAPIELVSPEVSQPVLRTGFQFVGASQLLEHFAGCVYVADAHRILTPNGALLKVEQFNAMFGGYVFSLDDTGEKTTKKAWEAFTESQAIMFPKVLKMDYRPDRAFGDTWNEDGVTYANAFRTLDDVGEPGDVTWFTKHVKKLYPADAEMLLDWMAIKVQNPGKCMLWAPVLIGTYGNGKTTISDVMAAVMGYHCSAIVQSSDVENKFNGWVFGNVFAAINDFKVGDKKDVIEILKPLITDRRIPYQKKGLDQETCTNMLGIMITSNHMDAIIKTEDDRRYAPFVSSHTSKLDLEADGMGAEYFMELDRHVRDRECIRHVRHFLMNRQVVNFPNRAPFTSTTRQVIAASLGGIEQEIVEAIEEGRTGFAGGWVSSFALDKLIERLRADRQIPRTKRRGLMQSLGYDWHPALKDGRVNNTIMDPCGNTGKPRLFIRHGHIHANLTSGAEVARHYAAAQGDPVAMAATQMVQ
ncbi:MAG: DUF5906 domain-containing protein, partial [Plesiomonas shigelloides]